jgi:hypothetical protein
MANYPRIRVVYHSPERMTWFDQTFGDKIESADTPLGLAKVVKTSLGAGDEPGHPGMTIIALKDPSLTGRDDPSEYIDDPVGLEL